MTRQLLIAFVSCVAFANGDSTDLVQQILERKVSDPADPAPAAAPAVTTVDQATIDQNTLCANDPDCTCQTFPDGEGRCGLFVFTGLNDVATNGDAKGVFISKCRLRYPAPAPDQPQFDVCLSLADRLFMTRNDMELFNINYDASGNAMSTDTSPFCSTVRDLVMAHCFHTFDIGQTPTTGSGGGGLSLLETDEECFPADATVLRQTPEGSERVTMRDLRAGDSVQSADLVTGQTFFSKVLFDWHSEHDHAQQDIEYTMLVHEAGSLSVTGEHFVAIEGAGFVPAKHIKVGDKLMLQSDGHLTPTEVTAIKMVVKHGMYSPVTWNGQLIVDGVHASSHISPIGIGISQKLMDKRSYYFKGQDWTFGGEWHTYHTMIHLASFPIRLAHALGLPSMLENFGASGLRCNVAPCDENLAAQGSTIPSYVSNAVFIFDKLLNKMW